MNQLELHRKQALKDLEDLQSASPEKLFRQRLETNLPLIAELFFSLYTKPEHKTYFKKLEKSLYKLFQIRSEELQLQDLRLLKEGNWYQSNSITGMQLYVDLFHKNLKGIEEKIPYFKELGINFLHLMPITTRPAGENDGGYAVSSYTDIDPRYGDKKSFLKLTSKLRENGIYLMLDFVVNHTSDEYPWAQKALKGDKAYQDYYYMFPDRQIPDAFEASLPEVFPTTSPGNFTYRPEISHWVMTVFNSYQWDLNYTNPRVFLEMFSNLVEMINNGVDVVRFDALAFLWKKIGTNSQNLPEAHQLISLFRMCLQVVAPGVVFLAEAIVAPHDIVKYFGEGKREGNECDIAYNASLMSLLWNSIATKKTLLLQKSLKNVPQKPRSSTWINYLRCHDDIGLGLDDGYIAQLGWDPRMHRKFLIDYYCQGLDWSPAVGYRFMENPATGDSRITGSCASLLGLEKAVRNEDSETLLMSLKKILMLHGIILSFGGIPMIYAGDELGTLNDYSYLDNEHKKQDSRWVNRPSQNWEAVAQISEPERPSSQIFLGIRHMIALRKKIDVFKDQNNLIIHDPNNPHLFVYERTGTESEGVLVIANFDESPQILDAGILSNIGYIKDGRLHDLLSGREWALMSSLVQIDPYQLLWLAKA
ncbi:alpha-amylase family protein [Muriicola soli]|uniref:Alpha amylase n=1 Tax=Muriicola soli TaxID=2507538 RepID=A0A411ECW1_9FLAO|nr:alpha-amylase family protein [Muriicola soli]QBA65240.1 alpha amylase [Muriicola soli]